MPGNYEIHSPLVYGNEEETGLLIDVGDDEGFDEPYEFTKNIEKHLPGSIHIQNKFMSNGGKIYAGGSNDTVDGPTNLERATPECATPTELTTYIRSHEELLHKSVTSYIANKSNTTGNDVRARIQRRVVDSDDSRKGCHDNFSTEGLEDIFEIKPGDAFLRDAILGHLATRSFVSGAGYVNRKGSLYYSQKIGGLESTEGYGYRGTMYRHETNEGGRLEVRCSDVNISDWATRMRLGSTALAMMIGQTPLRRELPALGEHDDMYQQAKRYNQIQLNPDGSITADRSIQNALRYQRLIADISIDELRKYTSETYEDLTWTAEELQLYCSDFQRVINEDAPISTLADRADWAVKINRVLEDYQDRTPSDKSASMSDFRAQYLDLMYDYVGMTASGGTAKRPKVGYGYKLRDKGHFRYTAIQPAVDRGVYQPPQHTRATQRARIIKKSDVDSIDWHQAIHTQNGVTKNEFFHKLRTDR